MGSLRFVIYEGALGVVCVVGPYRNILGLSVWLGAAPIHVYHNAGDACTVSGPWNSRGRTFKLLDCGV